MKKVFCANCGVELEVVKKAVNWNCPCCRIATIENAEKPVFEGCYTHPKVEDQQEQQADPGPGVRTLIRPYEIYNDNIGMYHHFEIYCNHDLVETIYRNDSNINIFAFELFCKLFDLNNPSKKSCLVSNYQLYGVTHEDG